MTQPLLMTAEGINFAYGRESVLTGVSIALARGEIVAVLGPNGSGKSTLIRLLAGLSRCGQPINWDGRDIRNWRRRELSRLLAYLPQSPAHEPGQRVNEVLALGRLPYLPAFGLESSRDLEVVISVATTLGLSDDLHRPMETLSGGQRQRVFLGRCLVQEPRALLLDEPTTFLDLHHQIELLKLLKKLAATGIGVVMASHDLNLTAAFADRIILLKDGQVAQAGSPTQVLTPQTIEAVYGVKMLRVDSQTLDYPAVVPLVER